MENTIQNFIYEFGAKFSKGFQRNYYVNGVTVNQQLQEWIHKHNETDIYKCSYAYENNDIENCKIISNLYLDFDGNIDTEENFNTLKRQVSLCYFMLKSYIKLKDEDIQLFFSGAKGFHIIIDYKILGLEPKENLNMDFKKFALWLQENTNCQIIDTGIYDRRRLLRVPNTINSKTGLYKVPITKELLDTFSLSNMLAYAKEKHEEQEKEYFLNDKASKEYKKVIKDKIKIKTKDGFVIPLEPKEMLPCAIKLLKEGALKGTRNNSCVAIASSILQSGESKEDAFAILKEWNTLNEPPLEEHELRVTFNSAYTMLQHNRRYGCNTYKDLGYCIGEKCKLSGGK